MTRLTRALVRKDLRLFLTDRRAVIVSFALPALLALFFGATLGGGGQKPPKVATAVVDLDGSAASKRLVAALAADPVLGATVVATADEARDLVRHERAEVAFVIPAGFAGDAAAAAASAEDHSARPAVTVLSDPTRGLSTSVARGELERAVMPALAPDLGAEATRCATRGLPYETTMSSVGSGDSGFDYGAHALAGMGIQFILIGAIDSAVGLITDRQRGLLKRIHAAPVARRTLILSRLLSGALIALAVLAFLYLFGHFTMGVTIAGSALGFGLVAVSFSLVASSVGLLVATFGKTPQATRGFGIFIVLIATMLSGAWFPTAFFPGWLQDATKLVPTRWAVDGLDAMSWRGLGLADALLPVGVLLLTALICTTWATWRFRWDD